MKPIHPSRGIRIASAVLLTIFLFAIAMQAQSQDSASPDLNEMKAKLQQLEQEMQSLKGQISAVQQSQPAPGAATSTPYPAAER
jgi:outer membrane murein-binding lipoprotein Lpp